MLVEWRDACIVQLLPRVEQQLAMVVPLASMQAQQFVMTAKKGHTQRVIIALVWIALRDFFKMSKLPMPVNIVQVESGVMQKKQLMFPLVKHVRLARFLSERVLSKSRCAWNVHLVIGVPHPVKTIYLLVPLVRLANFLPTTDDPQIVNCVWLESILKLQLQLTAA